MKSWYVIHPEPCTKTSKPALYCGWDNGCVAHDAVALALCLRVCFRVSRVAIAA
jgi:hypothetical protein